jgi:DNA-nicking Smr family endonuclease
MWPFRRKKITTGKRSVPLPVGRKEDDELIRPYVVTDTLDLHGFFPQQVEGMVADFIDNARELGLRRLRIVHGKGKSRMKWEVHQILKNHPEVESFGDAPPEEGHWGSTIVLLRDSGNRP